MKCVNGCEKLAEWPNDKQEYSLCQMCWEKESGRKWWEALERMAGLLSMHEEIQNERPRP